MEQVLAELFWVGLLPAATAVVMVACWRFVLPPVAVIATSLGGALVVGKIGLTARNNWSAAIDSLLSPLEATDWLAWFLLAATGIAVWDAYARDSWKQLVTLAIAQVLTMAFLLIVALPIRLLAGSIYMTSQWSLGVALGALFVWSNLHAAIWLSLSAGRANGRMRLRGALLVVVAAAMAVTVTLSASFSLGQLCGVVAAALGGALLADWLLGASGAAKEPIDVLSAAAGVLATAIIGLLLVAYFYAGLTATNAALLAVAAAAAGGRLPKDWPRSLKGQAAVRIVLCLLPLAIAVALAYAAFAQQAANPYG